MHITAWLDGKPVKDWDLGYYGSSSEARAALKDLCEHLNMRGGRFVYELSEEGKKIAAGDKLP